MHHINVHRRVTVRLPDVLVRLQRVDFRTVFEYCNRVMNSDSAVVFQYLETVVHGSAARGRCGGSIWFAIFDIKDRLVPFYVNDAVE